MFPTGIPPSSSPFIGTPVTFSSTAAVVALTEVLNVTGTGIVTSTALSTGSTSAATASYALEIDGVQQTTITATNAGTSIAGFVAMSPHFTFKNSFRILAGATGSSGVIRATYIIY